MTDNRATIMISLQSADQMKDGEQWVHLCPAGKFVGRDGRGPYLATDLNAIIQASARYAGKQLLPIDYDHQIDLSAKNGRPAVAAGWIKGMQARRDGIWGLVEWTAKAAEHIVSKEYRYLSPALIVSKDDGRVVRIERAGLTNNPNLNELTALSSAETDPMDADTQTFLASLNQMLSLPDDAEFSVVLAAVEKLTTATAANSVEPDPAQYVPIGEFERVTAELGKLHQGVSLQAAEIHVHAQIQAGNMLPMLRDWGVSLCAVNKPAFDAFIAKTRKGVRRLFEPVDYGDRSINRDTSLTSDERTVCLSMGISAEEYRASQKFIEGDDK